MIAFHPQEFECSFGAYYEKYKYVYYNAVGPIYMVCFVLGRGNSWCICGVGCWGTTLALTEFPPSPCATDAPTPATAPGAEGAWPGDDVDNDDDDDDDEEEDDVDWADDNDTDDDCGAPFISKMVACCALGGFEVLPRFEKEGKSA